MARVANDNPRRIAGPMKLVCLHGSLAAAGLVRNRPLTRSQSNRATEANDQKEFLQVTNEETPTTEQPRAQALAMRAGGRKKAAAKKGGRKAAPKKAGRKAAPKKKAMGRKKTAAKKAGRKVGAKRKAAAKKGGRKKAAARKKGGGRKKAAAAAASGANSMPSNGPESMT